jgi:hypothetical protein
LPAGGKREVALKLLMVLLFAVTAVAVASVSSPTDAARLVYSELLNGSIEGRQVLAWPTACSEGQAVDAWHESITVPFDGYLVLVDDMALANWEHPCRWVFVSGEGSMQVIDMLTPPTGIDKMSVEYSDLPVSTPADNQSLLDWFVPNPRQGNDPAHTYAWIISGGYDQGNNHIRYYGDVQFLYLTLTDDYGYTNDHIVICFADGLNPAVDNSSGQNSNPDLDGDGVNDFDFDATYSGIAQGYAAITGMVGPDDHLLLFTTDHGGSGKGGLDLPPEAYLNLWNTQTWNDDAYDTWINGIPTASFNVAMEQCYSGGFLLETVPSTGGQPRTFASAANGSESSWAGSTFPQYDEWAYWWIGAMHGSVPAGGSYPAGPLPADPDADGDGYISYGEAATAALYWDAYAVSGQEHPQYADDPDSCGDLYYLGGLIPGTGIADDGFITIEGGLTTVANPFYGSALLSFTLSRDCSAELAVVDLSGRRVATLVDGPLSAGEHNITWAADQVPAGIYIIRLSSGDAAETLRVVKF